MTIVTVAAVAALVGGGTWLLLHRDELRAVLGAGLLGHGVVLLLVLQGRSGRAPLVDQGAEPASDALPQALGLTAIVISFGIVAYLLALAASREDDE